MVWERKKESGNYKLSDERLRRWRTGRGRVGLNSWTAIYRLKKFCEKLRINHNKSQLLIIENKWKLCKIDYNLFLDWQQKFDGNQVAKSTIFRNCNGAGVGVREHGFNHDSSRQFTTVHDVYVNLYQWKKASYRKVMGSVCSSLQEEQERSRWSFFVLVLLEAFKMVCVVGSSKNAYFIKRIYALFWVKQKLFVDVDLSG